MAGGICQAFVEHHHDVAAERELDVDRVLGREDVRVAIQMRAEEDAFFGDFAQGLETEDLEAAGIGEDGSRPGHELVQAAQLADELVAGTQKQMIGVGENDFGVEVVDQIARGESFDGGLACRRA